MSGYKRCNGIVDCSDHSDEHNCPQRTFENFYDEDDDDGILVFFFLIQNRYFLRFFYFKNFYWGEYLFMVYF